MMNELFEKYFAGVATPSQEKEIFSTIRNSPEEMMQFREAEKQMLSGNELSDEDRKMISSIEQGLDRLRQKKVLSLFRRTGLWSAAAAAVVAFAIVLFHDVINISEPKLCVVEVPEGSRVQHTLPDGTLVWVNAGSKLSYDNDFARKHRRVSLTGEAYFEVVRNEKLPFVVSARDCDFTVLGTKFNIYAFESEKTVQAALMEGALKFEAKDASVILHPGELASYVSGSSSTDILKELVDADQYNSWINGFIKYDSITLPVLLNRLSRLFKVEMSLDTENFDTKKFRVSFNENESLDTILKAVCVILPIKVRCTDDGVYHISEK